MEPTRNTPRMSIQDLWKKDPPFSEEEIEDLYMYFQRAHPTHYVDSSDCEK